MKALEVLPAIILIVVVITVVIIAIYPKVWPLASSILGLNATIVLSPGERMRGSADVFFENYEKCVDSKDDNCKCVFNINLEKKYVVRILKRDDMSRVMLMEGNLRKSKLNKIVGEIEDVVPCVHIGQISKEANALDFGLVRKTNKLKVDGEKTYDLSDQLILYKLKDSLCVVPLKEGRTEFNIENILNLDNCKLK